MPALHIYMPSYSNNAHAAPWKGSLGNQFHQKPHIAPALIVRV